MTKMTMPEHTRPYTKEEIAAMRERLLLHPKFDHLETEERDVLIDEEIDEIIYERKQEIDRENYWY